VYCLSPEESLPLHPERGTDRILSLNGVLDDGGGGVCGSFEKSRSPGWRAQYALQSQIMGVLLKPGSGH